MQGISLRGIQSANICFSSPALALLYSSVVLRSILKHLSQRVVLKRRLPKEFGSVPLFVSPDSTLGYWRRDISKVDPFLLSMVRELVRPNMTVWDIGANVGLFSFAAASLGARVLAVEADPWLASVLHRSATLNRLPVTVLPAAVSDRHGFSRLHLSEEGRASNSMLGDGIAQTVVTITLDSLLDDFGPPQLLKIDVEGMEYVVLQGAERVLRSRPLIFCEVNDHYEEIGILLREADYEIHAARAANRQPLIRPSRDTLAVPHVNSRLE